jgi:hypothetical protein
MRHVACRWMTPSAASAAAAATSASLLHQRRFALQRRSTPPDMIHARQALPCSESLDPDTLLSAGAAQPPLPPVTSLTQAHPPPLVAGEGAAALTLLSRVPRDGIPVARLALSCGLSLPRFASALEFLRRRCDCVRVVRTSASGPERVVWLETARNDEMRLSLDSVRAMLAALAAVLPCDESAADARVMAAVAPPGSQEGARAETPGDACPTHGLSEGGDVIQELVAALQRDVRQEREARIAEERRAALAQQRMLSLLRWIACGRRGIRRAKTRQRHATTRIGR